MKNNFLLILGIIVILSGSHRLNAENAGTQVNTPPEQILQTITLKDGTVLKGHLRAVTGDEYVVETTELGQVRVPVQKISSITTGQTALPQAPILPDNSGQLPTTLNNLLTSQPQLTGSMGQAQQTILNDPEMMAEIQTLLSDPEIMNLLQDKSVMQDIMGLNPTTIQNNPNIQTLMQTPKMQNILNKLIQKTGAPSTNASTTPTIIPQ